MDRRTGSVAAAGFASQLREGTREEHERAESTPFVTALLAGEVPLDGYVRYLVQLSAVYTALESDRAAVAAHPQLCALLHPALDRAAAVEADLHHLGGSGWRDRHRVSPETRAYCARIDEVRTQWTGGYVAHHYTRYLGDLSGGQVIAGAVRRHYGLTGSDGTRFFVFDGIDQVKPFKDRYRDVLDALPWDGAERERVVDEARAAFRHNRLVLSALAI